jgi:plastocyanin
MNKQFASGPGQVPSREMATSIKTWRRRCYFMRILLTLTLLIALGFAGCVEDEPADDHGDGCEDAADHDACHEDAEDGMDNGMMEPISVREIAISWDGAYRVNGAYTPTSLNVAANSTIELTFTNNDPAVSHDFLVEGIEGASTAILASGASETITFDVGSPAALKFFCSVQGHRANGMEGDFVIE